MNLFPLRPCVSIEVSRFAHCILLWICYYVLFGNFRIHYIFVSHVLDSTTNFGFCRVQRGSWPSFNRSLDWICAPTSGGVFSESKWIDSPKHGHIIGHRWYVPIQLPPNWEIHFESDRQCPNSVRHLFQTLVHYNFRKATACIVLYCIADTFAENMWRCNKLSFMF